MLTLEQQQQIEADVLKEAPPLRFSPWLWGAYSALVTYLALAAFRAHLGLLYSFRAETAALVLAAMAFAIPAAVTWYVERSRDRHRAFLICIRIEQAEAAERERAERKVRSHARWAEQGLKRPY